MCWSFPRAREGGASAGGFDRRCRRGAIGSAAARPDRNRGRGSALAMCWSVSSRARGRRLGRRFRSAVPARSYRVGRGTTRSKPWPRVRVSHVLVRFLARARAAPRPAVSIGGAGAELSGRPRHDPIETAAEVGVACVGLAFPRRGIGSRSAGVPARNGGRPMKENKATANNRPVSSFRRVKLKGTSTRQQLGRTDEMQLLTLLVWGIFCQEVWVGRRIFSFVSFFARSEGSFLRLVGSRDDDQRGARLQSAEQSRHNLVFGGSRPKP